MLMAEVTQVSFILSPVLQVMEECSQSGGEHGRQYWIMEGFNATRQMEVDSA